MNERIKKLKEQATSYTWNGNDVTEELDEQKFAELIVRECIDITESLSKLYPRTDVAFDQGYTLGTTRATNEIKQRFGIEPQTAEDRILSTIRTRG